MGNIVFGEKKLKSYSKVFFAILITFMAVFYSCKKDEELSSYSVPDSVTPKDNGSAEYANSTDLKWSAKNEAGTKYNVYFGETQNPELYKSSLAAQTVNVPVIPGRTYFWKIGTLDHSGNEMLSPLYTFKVKVLLNLDKFTGSFDCNEPKYSHYDVTISKISKDTLQIDNFWDLKWPLKYAFDELGNVKILPTTFSPDPMLKYLVTGTGTYNEETSEFTVNYHVQQTLQGYPPVSMDVENNVHVFKKK
jgi:hypothetical protein